MNKDRKNSRNKAAEGVNVALYSAALQDHYMKNNNFDFLQLKNKPQKNKNISNKFNKSAHKQSNGTKQIQQKIKKLQKQQKNSILRYENETLKKMKQLKNDEQKMIKYNNKLTLAQKLGIVEKPPLPLTSKDWQIIQNKSKQRKDSQSICSICLQNYKIQQQIILSCSHVFHKKCLNSFQQHNKIRCCPICRKKNYQKKIIDQAIKIFTIKCIVTIQRIYRGSKSRIQIYGQLVQQGYVCKSKLFNRRLIGFRMWKLSSKINEKVKRDLLSFQKAMIQLELRHKKESQNILQQIVRIQRQKIINQGAIQGYLQKLGIKLQQKIKVEKDVQSWEIIMKKGAQRVGPNQQCAICLMPLWSKPVYLLSCTHVFHVNCIEGFERYSVVGSKNRCPCCRAQYQKKVVQRK